MITLPELARKMERTFIGYDNVMSLLNSELTRGTAFAGASNNFPPYNIRKIDDNKFVIEMAVAGFGKQDINIDLLGDSLKITGSIKQSESADYLYNGLAARDFSRAFTLNNQVVVNNATLLNGILNVFLERIVPESQKPRRISIEDEPASVSMYAAKTAPQLLTENDRAAAKGKLM
jgi:molecular chaperone IbpA